METVPAVLGILERLDRGLKEDNLEKHFLPALPDLFESVAQGSAEMPAEPNESRPMNL